MDAATPKPEIKRHQVVKVAQAQVGKPYVFGTQGPRTFDCSGLIHYVYAKVGLAFARVTAAMLSRVGKPVHGKLRPGDIIVVNGGSHVVLYVGNGEVIHAPYTGARVRYAPVSRYLSRATSIRRLIFRR
jgi:cell wall-associated NlpC family hydrolase